MEGFYEECIWKVTECEGDNHEIVHFGIVNKFQLRKIDFGIKDN